jgi:hypothetical protein
MHWTLGYGAAFSNIFLASSFSAPKQNSRPPQRHQREPFGERLVRISQKLFFRSGHYETKISIEAGSDY